MEVIIDRIGKPFLHNLTTEETRLIRGCKKSSPHSVCQFHNVCGLCNSLKSEAQIRSQQTVTKKEKLKAKASKCLVAKIPSHLKVQVLVY